MPRPERPLDSEDSPLLQFAADLRRLREKAGSPTYRDLSRRAHYSPAALSEAAAGRKLPTLALMLAYVDACRGDRKAWETRWRELAEEGLREVPDGEAPYVGLAAFRAEDADRFFGRDALVRELLNLTGERSFVGVVGASGAGKSSLLRAGLVPKLDRPALVFTPGAHPREECAVQLARFTGESAVTVREELADPDHLRLRQVERDVLFVVDQEIATVRAEMGPLDEALFSPDGSMLFLGGSGGKMKLLDARGSREIAAFEGCGGAVLGAAFSPNGRMLATACQDGTVQIWDVDSRRVVAVLKGHEGMVRDVAFSSDGRTLASGGDDGGVRLWDVASRTQLAALAGHTGGVMGLAFAPGSDTLASASYDGTVRLWDARTRTHLGTLAGHVGVVWSVAFGLDGMLTTSSDDGSVRVWDLDVERIARRVCAAPVANATEGCG